MMEEKLIGEFQGVKLNKQPGVLLLTSRRVAWAPGDDTEAFHANHLYEDIKAQRISAVSSSKVQLQLVLHNGSQVKFHFTGDNAVEQRERVKSRVAQKLGQNVPISPELEAKNSLLKNNPTLYQLYKDLVTTSVISAEEFWASHSPSPQSGEKTGSNSQQEGGVPSAFLADVQAVHDGCNTTRYNLSADAMQAIFKTYPAVKRRHLENVPYKMTEEEFWTKFFQSQLLHQDGGGSNTNDGDMDLQTTSVTPFPLNTTETASSILDQEGYGSAGVHGGGGREVAPSLLHRCNHHSSRVLQVLEGDMSTGEGSTDGIVNPDTPRRYLSLPLSQPVPHTSTQSQALGSLALSLCSWQVEQVVDPQMAEAALSHLVPGGVLVSGGCGQKVTSLLTEKQQQELLRHQMAIAELLRHFWSCFPARTPQLEAKVHRLHQSLVEYGGKHLLELQTELDSDSLQVLSHLNTTLEKAGQHYNKWLSRKKTTGK